MRRTLAVRVMPMKMTLNLRAASSPGQRAGDVFKPSETEWWRLSLLSAKAQRDAECGVQLSFRPLERTKQ